MSVEPSSGRIEGQEHALPVRVYYEDTDFTGVVYHGAYVRFFERGRTEALRSLGVVHAELLAGDNPIAFAVTKLSVEFQRAARIDDALQVRTSFSGSKGPRLFIRQRIVRGDEPIAEAEVEVVCIDSAGRPKRPPAGMLQAMEPLFTRA